MRAQVEILSDEEKPKCEARKETPTNGKKLYNYNNNNINNNNYCATNDDDKLIKEIESKVNGEQSTSHLHPSIVALTAACSEKILNPKYLLQGGGSPFVGPDLVEVKVKNGNGMNPGTSTTAPSTKISDIDVNTDGDTKKDAKESVAEAKDEPQTRMEAEVAADAEVEPDKPVVILRSQKMRGLKDLLLAEKLNTQAIQLQLTAQSQVQIGGKKGRGDFDGGVRPKRTRRE